MPRKTRNYLPYIPAHIVQRGHNRNSTFLYSSDFEFYKRVLGEGLKRYSLKLHAYCLMTNHVHLLVTPEFSDSISRMMQHIGRQYVRYFNNRYQRSGTLWEGRHKGSIVDAEGYLLACYRYIEMNPVVARIVNHPAGYKWSSYHHNALGKPDQLITAHSIYSSLSKDNRNVCRNYRQLFEVPLTESERDAVKTTLEANYPLGNERFRHQIEKAMGKPVGRLRPGGPRVIRKQAL